MPKGSNRCFRDSAGIQKQDAPRSQYIALVASNTGKFFGTAVADSRAEALAEATSLCRTVQANTASTSDEREEECRFKVWIENGCVALSRSHDMYYSLPEKFVAGMSTDTVMANASSESYGSCQAKGGESCFIVPESVRCTD